MNNRAASSDEALLASLSQLFGEDGKPSPLLKTCLAHFKDRFREVVKLLRATAKPQVLTETSGSGSRVLMSVALPPGAEIAHGVIKRLITPTMTKAGFQLAARPWGLGASWGSELSREDQPTVSVSLEPGELKAALLFHHPEDDRARAARNKAQTYDALPVHEEVSLRDGSVLVAEKSVFRILKEEVLFKASGDPLFQTGVEIQLKDQYDPLGWNLLEAAQSSRATSAQLVQLAERAGARVKETQVRVKGGDPLWEEVPGPEWLLEPLKANLKRLGYSPIQESKNRSLNARGFVVTDDEGEIRIRVERLVTWSPSSGGVLLTLHVMVTVRGPYGDPVLNWNPLHVELKEPVDLTDRAALAKLAQELMPKFENLYSDVLNNAMMRL